MGYDLIACATGTFYLIFSSRVQGSLCVAFSFPRFRMVLNLAGCSNMSRFIRRVLANGLLYCVVVFIANLYVYIPTCLRCNTSLV